MAYTPRKRLAALVLAAGAAVLTSMPAQAAISAPRNEARQADARIAIAGYGARTVGGASGRSILVTNLRDSGRGSLRAALEASGRRIVRFRVAGTIALESPIKIKSPYITVAGNTAPGQGVQIRGAPVVVQTHDVILRYLRIRPGDKGMTSSEAADYDAVTLNGVGRNVYNVLLDHLSLLWGPDIGGLAVLGNVHHVTVQNSILGEGLRYSRHPEARGGKGHSTAINITPLDGRPATRITFYSNLFTTSDFRMPRVMAASCIDVINNVIYNWGHQAGQGNPRSLNMVGNWFRRGPMMERGYIWYPDTGSAAPTKFRSSVFLRNNKLDGFRGGRYRDGVVYASSVRCGGTSVRPRPVDWVFSTVLRQVGPRLPVLDAVDRRVIRNVRYRSGRFVNGVDFAAPHPYWPALSSTLR